MLLVVQLRMCMSCGTIFSDPDAFYCGEQKCGDTLVRDVEFRLEGLENVLTRLHNGSRLTVIDGELDSHFYDDESMLRESQQNRLAPGTTVRKRIGETIYLPVND